MQVAVNTPTFTLSITPAVCVVDVVHDGSNQLLQAQSKDCDSQLPLLVPVQNPQLNAPLFSLPFAGTENGEKPVIVSNRTSTPWSSVTSIQDGRTLVSSPPNVPLATSGITLAVLVIAVSMDLAIFEMRFSRKALALLRNLLTRKR
ncbi:MAG TPA: hypothetical protein VF733_02520 [Candidatus Saccharimonadales bacterium]